MKRAAVALLLIFGACAAGLASSEALYRWPVAREMIARTFGRGELLAVVNGTGIYDSDVPADGEVAQSIIAANLRREARDEQISEAAVEREFQLLTYQFGAAKVFTSELEASRLSAETLGSDIAEHLRTQQWIEKQIAPELRATEEECRAFYASNLERFAQPARFRVSHLFLAAPEATPPEVVQAKQDAAKALAKRLSKREEFALLVAEASEDEATKARGGDLGFFCVARMPADFMAEVEKLGLGKPSTPLRLHLGFHILQLTDSRSARQMPFEEVHDEIALHLTNAKRTAAVERLRQRLMVAEFIRTPL